jgi:hypothetical protein
MARRVPVRSGMMAAAEARGPWAAHSARARSVMRRCDLIDPLAIFAMIPLFPPAYSCCQETNINEDG